MILPITYLCITDQPNLLSMMPDHLLQYPGPMKSQVEKGVVRKLHHINKSGLTISRINIPRKYVSIIQPLEIREIREVINYSSKVTASLTSLLLNNTNLSFHLLRILTSAYQLLMSPNLTALEIEGWWHIVCPLEPVPNCHLQLLQWPCQITFHQMPWTWWCHNLLPSLHHPLYMADCFKASMTHSIGTLSLLDNNKNITLNTSSLP